MPIQPTYPGVYIEEIPGGVHTIIGVATSITAFVGRAQRGPTDKPITIFNFGDYQRIFGGLWNLSSMSFAVRDFFLNGGSQAVIIRVFKSDPTKTDGVAQINIPTSKTSIADELQLIASSPGDWGNNLEVAIDYETKDKSVDSLFNITISEVVDKVAKSTEKFFNVSNDKSKSGYLPRVLEQNSNLIRVKDNKMPRDKPLLTEKIIPESPPSSPPLNPPFMSSPPLPVEVFSGGNIGLNISDIELFQGRAINGIQEDMQASKKGIYALEQADLFNILCIPPYLGDENDRPIDVSPELLTNAVKYCQERRAMMIIDSRSTWRDVAGASKEFSALTYPPSLSNDIRSNAAIFFPRIKQPNILVKNEIEEFVPCGMIAGTFARTDAQRGVWKAPAGIEAGLNGITEFTVPLTDNENGILNQIGVNCLRSFPIYGNIVWGARTVDGADQLTSDWKYIPVRRTALFIEESLYRGTKWVVFEPNDERLWAQIRLNVGAFMHDLFRKGAFQGKSPKDAYLVKCDSETTTQNDINSGIVNILVGFAPLKPAEFVIIQIQQLAGQIDT
ncbi:MAG: phage tail sheath family protein [Ginsengibacter sp.]